MSVVGYDYKVTEQRVTCPFNPAHQVPNLQKHLTKCKSYNKDVPLKQCIFNGTHFLLEPEYMHHLATCEDRHLMDRHLHAVKLAEAQKPAACGNMSMPTTWRSRHELAVRSDAPDWDDVVEEEDWSTSSSHTRTATTYDPERATTGRAIFRRPERHMGSSERRQFRANAARELSDVISDSASTVVDGSISDATSAFTATALRRPTSDPRCLGSVNRTGVASANPQLGAGRGRGRSIDSYRPVGMGRL